MESVNICKGGTILEKILLDNFFKESQGPEFSVDYWDGTNHRYGEGGNADFKIVFKEKIPANKILKDPSLAFGEAYMDGIIDFEGNLQEVVETFYKCNTHFSQKNGIKKIIKFKPTSIKKQKQDIEHHYDLGNDFYELWLDDTMSYSCAYFCSEKDSLHQAQLQKIDYILKKLQLNSGEKLLDIGSGWGWLIIRAAQQYGVQATGITLSNEQYAKTKQRIKELGLEGQVDVKLMDYRELADTGEKFNRVVSVGMIEHVGRANLPLYMKAVEKLLEPGGISVLHSITSQVESPPNEWISKYIFPGGYIPSIRQLISLLPDYDFFLVDVESLRLHYAETLTRWAQNFEENISCITEKYDERFARMWRLYLNSCAANFKIGGIDLHQLVFTKGVNNNLLLTREYLYK